MKINNKIYHIAMLLLLATCVLSCKRYGTPDTIFEEYSRDTVTQDQRRVLMIVIDGAVGEIVEEIMPQNIASLLPNSKYTFEGLTENLSTDATSWASLLTGVSYNIHKVENDGFRPASSLNDPHSTGTYYPSLFYRLLESRPNFETVAITPWEALGNNFMAEATHLENVSDDLQAKERAVRYLKDENPKLITVNFRSVLEEGLQTGFSSSNPAYVSAIETIDNYVGDLVSAVKSRPDYEEEQWLIVVLSSNGGVNTTTGGSSKAERNTFSVFYNQYFQPLKLESDIINATRFYGWDGSGSSVLGVRAQAQDPDGNYNPKRGELTIQVRVKFNKNANGGYDYFVPAFLSKTASRAGNTMGWSFLRNSNKIEFWMGDEVGSAALSILSGDVATDGAWHTITGTINATGSSYKMKLYVDGMLTAQGEKAGTVSIESAAPLVMGYWPYDFTGVHVDMYMGDLRIWNRELSEEEIVANVCVREMTPDQSTYENLVGYWPANDEGGTFANKISGKPNFDLSGDYRYNLSALDIPCSKTDANVLVQNLDIVSQIYYWLRVDPAASWGVEGVNFLNRFEAEFIR